MSEGLPAFLFDSRAKPANLSMVERNDPYWDPNWVPGSQAVWSSSAGSPTGTKKATPEKALKMLFGGRRRKSALALIACLDSWSTVTAEQAALIAGDRALLKPTSQVVHALYSLGVLDMGRYPGPLARKEADPVWLYRRAGTNALSEHITQELTWAEWVSASGGLSWSSTASFDRHNVLATELVLRAAEFLKVGTVLGEKFVHASLLAAADSTIRFTHRADALIVREDGLRIAVEMTASRSAQFEKKVERWARFMAENPLEDTGLMVVFVAVPHPGDVRKRSGAAEVRKAVQKVMRSFPERSRNAPAGRIGVVEWADWFPDRHLLTEKFINMEVQFPLGRTPTDRWKTIPLAETSFDPADDFDATAVIESSSVLAHVPSWLRTADPVTVLGTPLSRSGKELPVMPAARPEILAARPSRGGTPKRGMISRAPDRLVVPG